MMNKLFKITLIAVAFSSVTTLACSPSIECPALARNQQAISDRAADTARINTYLLQVIRDFTKDQQLILSGAMLSEIETCVHKSENESDLNEKVQNCYSLLSSQPRHSTEYDYRDGGTL